ncbi:M16 family metallopeptidase [Solimicrobium silvestre]|uniref:Peptidase M16 inactive domain n=1 Tax=Solimicrobium silvestre TaxID=2099400 RepID=A0A2S9GSE2_9BURK|nr:pitrilysin family protein [Solimicrobium silvestre]PRC90631.1 Peptidase M16 inactive domain [Solimicrobium silvestre]
MPVQIKRVGFVVLMCFSLLQPSAWAGALPKDITQHASVEGITEYRLANGLKVLLMPDASKPTVTVNITYLVGSRQENYGETGMAHLLEHMMFKGTPKIPKIDIDFNQRGMHSNASTSLDRTNYFEQFEASDDNLHWAIKMEADRMIHSNIAKKDLDSEMTVVRNEFEMGENSPINVLIKRLQSIAFDWHNYGNSTIGNRSDIENVKIENLQAFYHLYYQPDNAVLLVAGKFDVNKTLTWISSEFGAIPKPKRSLPVFWTVEPTQDGERNFVVRRKGDTQIVMVAYKIPAALHPDNDALSFAGDILSDNPSGRLHKALVETGKAVDVFSTSIGSYAPGLQVIGAVVKKDDAIEPVRDALVAAIESFASTPPTPEEMERMKRNYRNQAEKTLTDPETIGLELSEVLALGDWRYFFQNRDQVEQVTSEQVAAAAARYFKRDNRIVGMFIPEDQPQRAEIPAAPSIQEVMQGFKPKLDLQTAEVFDPSPANIDKRTVHSNIGGLNVAMLTKKNKGETVSVALALHWGDEKSLFEKKMISSLTNAMLTRGNSKYSREQLNDEFSKLKITGDIYHFDTTRENLAAALALVAQVLKEPSFPENEFEQLKKQILSSLEGQRSEPNALAKQALDQHFNHYPKGDWRSSVTIAEAIERVNAITLDELKVFHKNFYGASKGELSLVGDIDVAATSKVIEQAFGNWTSLATYKRIDDAYTEIAPLKININTPDKENGLYLAKMNLNLNDQDEQYPALLVANYLFGGGAELNSRVMERIRQKDGLSYGGGSSLRVGSLDNASSFQLHAIAAPQNLAKVAVAMQEELNRVLKDGFSAEEVARAKSGLKQQAVQSRSQDASLVEDWNSYQYLQRSFAWTQAFEDKVNVLTAEQVNAAFKKMIDPSKLTVVIAGDESKMSSDKAAK